MLDELRHAARRLLADRWTTASAVVTAALGAGLNTAVFAVAYGVLLRPLPYADAGRLMMIDVRSSLTGMEEWRGRLSSFDAVAAHSREQLTVSGAGDAQLVAVAHVDDAFFATLGAAPRRGRAFGRGDAGLAVISDRFARQLGGDPLGRPLVVGSVPLTVAGVMPPDFAFPTDRIDIWSPAAAAPRLAFDRDSDARRFQIVGRLKRGVPLTDAEKDAARVRTALDPKAEQPRGPLVVPLQTALVGSVAPVLLAFAAAGGIVLLIACANISTILIGRTFSRARELAVRRALGANPARLLASLVSESVLIVGSGAALGVLLAIAAVRAFDRWAAGLIPRLGDVHVDWRVLAFAVASAALSAILAAAPAAKALGRGALVLRASGSAARGVDRRLRGALVVTQIALAVTLLAGGALLTRTIVALLGVDLGVAARGATVMRLRLTEIASFSAGDRAPVLTAIVGRVRAMPGVAAAGAGTALPPGSASLEFTVRLVDDRGERRYAMSAAAATPGYLPAIGARLLQGRDFAEGDERREHPVVILSEGARGIMPPGEVIGRELPMALPGPLRNRGRPTVIGVVSDIKYLGLDARTGPGIYVIWNELPAGQLFLAVRSSSLAASALAPSLGAIVREADARLPVMPVRALEDMVQDTVADRRLRALLGAAVALLAFAVAMVGLAGTLMRVVSERRHELAIRAALGATPARTVGAIVGEGAVLSAVGIAIGLGGAIAVGRALRSLLHGVSPHDPLTLAGVSLLVVIVSLLACYGPARRAARIDPVVLLRAD